MTFIKGRITKIYQENEIWFIDCKVLNDVVKNKVMLFYNNTLPLVGDYAIIKDDNMSNRQFALCINKINTLEMPGESIIGELTKENYLYFASNNINSGSKTSKINLKASNVHITDNISKEREQDALRSVALLSVLNGLLAIPELSSIVSIINTAITNINTSKSNSTTLKTAFDSTFNI